MKMNMLKSAAALVFLFAVFAVTSSAQQSEPIAGGYAKISTKSVEAKKAAAVALRQHAASHPKEKLTLVKVVKAEQQVVAGMNYRICLAVLDHRGVRKTITAVVYHPINKKERLTNWSTGGCTDL